MVVPLIFAFTHKPSALLVFLLGTYFLVIPSLIFNRNHQQFEQANRLRQFIQILTLLNTPDNIIIDFIPEEEYELPDRDIEPLPETELRDCDISDNHQCPICFEEMSSGMKGVVLSCQHVFHGSCINRWRRSSDQCPVCRSQHLENS